MEQWDQPFIEVRLNAEAAMLFAQDWGGTKRSAFHGGAAGVPVGGLLLPRNQGGRTRPGQMTHPLNRADRVYVSPVPGVALVFAVRTVWHYGVSCLYGVEAEGRLEPDPDHRAGLAYMTERARVLRVVQTITGSDVRRCSQLATIGYDATARVFRLPEALWTLPRNPGLR